jgi:YVTN family beta-propeller protein
LATAAFYATRPTPLTPPPNSVALIDQKINKVTGYVSVGSRPDAITIGFGSAWVANRDDKTLMRINLKTHRIEKTISLPGTPTGLAVGSNAVWVVYGYLGALSRVVPDYNSLSDPLYLPINRNNHSARGSVAVGAGSVWAAFGDSSIFRISATSRRFIGPLYAGTQPSALTIEPESIWIANWLDHSVTRFDPATNSPRVGPITVGVRPSGVTIGDGAVWVSDTGDDAVSRINGAADSVEATIPVGKEPAGIYFGAGSVWVANSGDGTVSRIDPRTNNVMATIRVGNEPAGIAVGGDTVWLTVQAAPPN